VTKGKNGDARILVLSLLPDGADQAAAAEIKKNAGKHDYIAAVFHGFLDKAKDLVRKVPEIDLVIVADGNGSPDERPQQFGNTLLLHPGLKGRNIVKLTLGRADGINAAEAYEVDTVHTTIPKDAIVEELVSSYRTKLDEAKIVDSLKGKRTLPAGAGYAGNDKCASCHIQATEAWKKSKHSHAIESMKERRGQLDPECIKCHAVGWYSEPPSGEVGAYNGNPASKFANVGCESCHGPAAAHVRQPYDVKLTKDITCQRCHDVENSPDFDRNKYWPKIEHWLDSKTKDKEKERAAKAASAPKAEEKPASSPKQPIK
jgi:hypothetical protein